MVQKDQRFRVMNEILSGMKVCFLRQKSLHILIKLISVCVTSLQKTDIDLTRISGFK